jgi:hypothetical protein
VSVIAGFLGTGKTSAAHPPKKKIAVTAKQPKTNSLTAQSSKTLDKSIAACFRSS